MLSSWSDVVRFMRRLVLAILDDGFAQLVHGNVPSRFASPPSMQHDHSGENYLDSHRFYLVLSTKSLTPT
jgi:hypothetical protein